MPVRKLILSSGEMRCIGTTHVILTGHQADTRPPLGHTQTTTREMHHPGGDGNELDVYLRNFPIFLLDHLVFFGRVNS